MHEEQNKSKLKTLVVCTVCGKTFDRNYDSECPVCGWDDILPWTAENNPDSVVAPNWVTLNEARWIWNKFHCNVDEYALKHKKKPTDKLRMDG